MTEPPPADAGRKRRIADIDLAGLAEALGDRDEMKWWWYDPATGEVEPHFAEGFGYDDDDNDEDEPLDRGLVLVDPERPRKAYAVMVEFAESVGDRRTSRLLSMALEGRGAFRRFRDTLHEFQELREQWFAFESACSDIRAIKWLQSEHLVDDEDATAEITARNETADAVLAAVGADGVQIDVAEAPNRWDEIVAAVDAGRTVTLLRCGEFGASAASWSSRGVTGADYVDALRGDTNERLDRLGAE